MKICIKCGSTVKPETQLDYPYYCPHCDENLYSFEVFEVEFKPNPLIELLPVSDGIKQRLYEIDDKRK